MAAWRTVLPFSAVIGLPSIVSVTVSIELRSYLFYRDSLPGSARSLPLDLHQCRVVGVCGDRAHAALQWDLALGMFVSEWHNHAFNVARLVGNRDRDRHIRHFVLLLEPNRCIGSRNVGRELEPRYLRSKDPGVEEALKVAARRSFHDL